MEAYTARWVAKGDFYAKLAEAQRERAIEAYTARWVAMGEFYAGYVLFIGRDKSR